MYVPDTLDRHAMSVFDLQQKHAFGILIIHCYSDPQATDYANAQQLYAHLVTHYTQGISGRQHLEIIECNIDDLHLDKNLVETCEVFFMELALMCDWVVLNR